MDKQRISQLVEIVRNAPDIEVCDKTSRADKAFDEVRISQRRQIEESMSEWDKWQVHQNCKDNIETMGQYIKVYLEQEKGIALNGSLGYEGLTLSLNPWFRQENSWTRRYGSGQPKTYADMKGILERLIRDTKAYAKKNSYIFQSIVVLSDWHHGRGKGADYHFHLILFGIPKGVIADYIISWWTVKHHYGYLKRNKEDRVAGTVRRSRDIDFGWVTYCKDNMDNSTASTARWFGNGISRHDLLCFGRRWTLWGYWLPPKGTWDKTGDDGEVDNDDFAEFRKG